MVVSQINFILHCEDMFEQRDDLHGLNPWCGEVVYDSHICQGVRYAVTSAC